MTTEQLLGRYATEDPEKFSIFFRRIRGAYKQECVRACIRYLGEHDATVVGRQMLLWLSSGMDYCPTLFDPQITSGNGSRRTAIALRDHDPRFFTKLSRYLQDPRISKPTSFVLRVLHVIPALGDCGVVIPWLRSLEEHGDEQIRLQSAKALCELRPTRAMVERQLQSSEAQTRADALEALWRVPGSEAKMLFRFALADPDHRVVAKALIGLHLNDDATAVDRMIELSKHRSAIYRLSMVAAMSYTLDRRAVPALQRLVEDSSPAVREAAKTALERFPADLSGAADKLESTMQVEVKKEVVQMSEQAASEMDERASYVYEPPLFHLL